MRLNDAVRPLALLSLLLLACAPAIEPVVSRIGPAGGVVEAEGVKLEIPAGALESEVEIKVSSATDASAPDKVTALTPFFSFEPAGTTFAAPVAVTFELQPVPDGASVYWTKANGAAGYDALTTTSAEGGVRAEVSHFSTGFVGTAEATNDGTFDCDATEVIESKIIARDPKLTIGSRTARFTGVSTCNMKSLMPEAKYAEFSFGWVDETRIGTDEFSLASGTFLMNVLTGSSTLGAGNFSVVAQPTQTDGFKTPGAYGMVGIKADPLNSAKVDVWLLQSGSVTVVEHPRAEQGRCFEVKLNATLKEEKGDATLPVSGSVGCLTHD